MVRFIIGVVARFVFWIALIVIVVDAVLTLWRESRYALAVASAVFFPVTELVWPWKHEAFGYPLWWVFLVALIAYPISTFVGGLEPVD